MCRIAGTSCDGDALPLIFNNASIGGIGNPVVIHAGGAHRIFFVSGLPDSNVTPLPDPDGAQAISVSLSNLLLINGKATGGSGGGGGLGAGGALFVNKNANVRPHSRIEVGARYFDGQRSTSTNCCLHGCSPRGSALDPFPSLASGSCRLTGLAPFTIGSSQVLDC